MKKDFFEEWNETHTSQPSYQDAIEWARKEIIDKACEWLKARNVLTDASLEGFRKAMDKGN